MQVSTRSDIPPSITFGGLTSSQSSESGKSILPSVGISNLINHYPDVISDHLHFCHLKKCVPSTPRCVRCMDMGIEDCRYGSVKKRGIGSTLRMGQACVPCWSVAASSLLKGACETDTNTLLPLAARRRKAVSGLAFKVGPRLRRLTSPNQRCDGKRPCMTCVNGEGGDGCTYEPRQRSHRTNASALPISRETESHPPSIRTLPSQPPATRFLFSEPLTCPSLGIPLLTLSNSSGSTFSLLPPPPPRLAPSSHARGEIVLGPSSDFSVVRHTHDTTECVLRPTVSSFTVLPSIHFQTVPWPLQIPLSLILPERMQISSVAGATST